MGTLKNTTKHKVMGIDELEYKIKELEDRNKKLEEALRGSCKMEWVECKYKDRIPNGHYFFFLDHGRILHHEIHSEKVIYSFATHLIRIDFPEIPKAK